MTTMLVSRNFNSKNFVSKKSDGSQVKESTDSSATMDEDDGKGTFIASPLHSLSSLCLMFYVYICFCIIQMTKKVALIVVQLLLPKSLKVRIVHSSRIYFIHIISFVTIYNLNRIHNNRYLDCFAC